MDMCSEEWVVNGIFILFLPLFEKVPT